MVRCSLSDVSVIMSVRVSQTWGGVDGLEVAGVTSVSGSCMWEAVLSILEAGEDVARVRAYGESPELG